MLTLTFIITASRGYRVKRSGEIVDKLRKDFTGHFTVIQRSCWYRHPSEGVTGNVHDTLCCNLSAMSPVSAICKAIIFTRVLLLLFLQLISIAEF